MKDGDRELVSIAHRIMSLAELLPEACTLLEGDARPEARAWIRKAQRAAFDIIGRREPAT